MKGKMKFNFKLVGQHLLTTSQHWVKKPLQPGRLNWDESRQNLWRRHRFVRGDPSIWESEHSETKVSGSETQHVSFFFFSLIRETNGKTFETFCVKVISGFKNIFLKIWKKWLKLNSPHFHPPAFQLANRKKWIDCKAWFTSFRLNHALKKR